MDSEVSRTLAELERKLHELERALSSVGERKGSPPPSSSHAAQQRLGGTAGASSQSGFEAPQTGARLVDESIAEPSRESPFAPAEQRPPQAEQPADAGMPAQPERGQAFQRLASPSPQAGAARTPGTPSPQDSIDLAELVAFRERLEDVTRELIDDYTRIISLPKAPPPQ